jgi:hypothetical protein
MPIEPIASGRADLVDVVDHLLNRGAVLSGDATLSVAGVDLVYVGLNLLIASVETMREHGDWPGNAAPAVPFQPSPPPPLENNSPIISTSSVPPLPGLGEGQDEAPTTGVRSPDAAGAINRARTETSEAQTLTFLAPEAVETERDAPERSLARLVLALVELLRQLVERQALRRMEGNSLSDEQIERMGRSLMELSERMADLRAVFGLNEQDLALDLGPIGRLL